MREIKFKAQNENGTWVFFSIWGINPPLNREKFKNLCEFTGKYDMHGDEIYEGDIIKYVDEFEGEKSYGIVTFGTYDLGCNMGEYQYVVHGWYALLIPGSEDELMRSEILTKEMIEGNVTIEGNRWDNPELLKEDE